MMDMATLEEKIAGLPPELRKEVGDFVEFLLAKKRLRKTTNANFLDLAGAWEDMDEETFSRLKEKVNQVHAIMNQHFRGASSDSD